MSRLLAHPGIDLYLRLCLSTLGGGLMAFALFVGFVSVRNNAGFTPLPNAGPLPLLCLSLAGGVATAITIFLIHRAARRRRLRKPPDYIEPFPCPRCGFLLTTRGDPCPMCGEPTAPISN